MGFILPTTQSKDYCQSCPSSCSRLSQDASYTIIRATPWIFQGGIHPCSCWIYCWWWPGIHWTQDKYNTNLFLKSINVIESPHLRKIFLLLRKELRESDIPGHTSIRMQIGHTFKAYLKQLEDDMKVYMIFLIVLDIYFIFHRHLLARSHLQMIVGQIQIKTLLWLSQHIGLSPLTIRDLLRALKSFACDQILLDFIKSLDVIQENIWLIVFYSLLTGSTSHKR